MQVQEFRIGLYHHVQRVSETTQPRQSDGKGRALQRFEVIIQFDQSVSGLVAQESQRQMEVFSRQTSTAMCCARDVGA